MHINQFRLLGTRRFVPLLLTQFGGSLNDHILKNLLIIFAVEQITRETLMTVSVGVFLVPFLLFSQQAGIMADTSEKAHKIRYIKLFEIFVVVLIAGAAYLDNLLLMFIAIFLLGTKVAVFLPFKHSIIPQLMEVDELEAANGFLNVTSFASSLLGVWVYMHYGLFVLSMMMLVVAIVGWVCSLFIPPAPALSKDKYSYDLFEQDRIILFSIISIAWFWFVGFTYLLLLRSYCQEVFASNYMALPLVGNLVCGVIIGSLLVNIIVKSEITLRYMPVALLGMILFSTDMIFASIAGSVPRIMIDLFCLGLVRGLFIVPLYATLQHRSVHMYRARNIASSSILNAKLIVISFILVLILQENTIPTVYELSLVPFSAVLLLIYASWSRA